MKDNVKEILINGKKHILCEYMYGVLAMDHDNPLCCVSEANNSFSIDYWKGCSYQCAYCHVQGIYEDLDEDYQMYKKPIPRSKFTIEEIIDALIKHDYFKKNESIISIATSSTEPFANDIVTESTLRIMEYFVELGYKNPFWIVTKAGIPNNISDRLKKITSHGNKIMISICYANNPKEIEPAQNNRFRNIETLKGTNVTVSWYMRPLVKEWSASKENLEKLIKEVSKYSDYIDMIIPGGLRWTEGIEFGLKEIRNLPMPELIKEYDKKTLSSDIQKTIIDLCQKYFPNKAVYFNSSCGLSHMLERNNIALLNVFNKEVCSKSICLNPCKNKCERVFTKQEIIHFEDVLKKEGIDINIENIDEKIISNPCFESYPYTIRQQIKKTIALETNRED